MQSDFRAFLAEAPIQVALAVLDKWRVMRGGAPPQPEFGLDGNQWTIMVMDDPPAISLKVEEGAMKYEDWQNRVQRATQQQAPLIRTAKMIRKQIAGEINPEIKAQHEAGLQETQEKIEQMQSVIDSEAPETHTQVWIFPLGEIE